MPYAGAFTVEGAPVKLCWHEHPVIIINSSYDFGCQGCRKDTGNTSDRYYQCETCYLTWHYSCVPSSLENINHPCHLKHPLEFLHQELPNYSDGKCSLCQQELFSFVYHCKLCDFSVDARCANQPPPLTIDHPKCHEHELTLMVKVVSFTCNACGMHGEGTPYVCLPCSLMFHYECVDRPHVININRHEHRVTHTSQFTFGNRVCGICRQDINWRYGAYSCNKCPDYFVHTRCATRKDVWDGLELQGVPEEEVDTAPFEVIDEGVIKHFSHEEHNLFLIEDVFIDGGGEGIHCEACCRPISFDKYYKCMECDFMLHEECANLPLQKRHALSTRILSLSSGPEEDGNKLTFKCDACSRVGTGFRYSDGKLHLDVHCASLSWFRHRKLHQHTLFLTTLDRGDCVGCDQTKTYVLSCTECKFSLDFKCATLPVVIKHRCDDHYLFLSSGEKEATGRYWCEICEAQITNPEKWYYTCHDCGIVCHINCVTGDTLNIKPGLLHKDKKTEVEAVVNDRNTRPLCSNSCGARCRFPIFYKLTEEPMGNRILCSIECTENNLED